MNLIESKYFVLVRLLMLLIVTFTAVGDASCSPLRRVMVYFKDVLIFHYWKRFRLSPTSV